MVLNISNEVDHKPEPLPQPPVPPKPKHRLYLHLAATFRHLCTLLRLRRPTHHLLDRARDAALRSIKLATNRAVLIERATDALRYVSDGTVG